MTTTSSHAVVDPFAVYLHAETPPHLGLSVAAALGPYFILMFLFCLVCGANLSLYGVYLHLFASRRSGDSLLLHLAVFASVASNVALAVYGLIRSYQSNLIELYAEPGFDMNVIEPYVVWFHILQGVGVAVGQVYFVVRIAKLFDLGKMATKIVIGFALVAIVVQFGLIVAFGIAFYSIGYKSQLLNPSRRRWAKQIIFAWTVVFITLEASMTITTIVRLYRLRRQTSMDAARRVNFRLAVYSVQGQALLTAFSLGSLVVFSRGEYGWCTPMYLLSGCLYTMVLLANLCYRSVVRRQMHEVSRSGSQECRGNGSKTCASEDKRVEVGSAVRDADWTYCS